MDYRVPGSGRAEPVRVNLSRVSSNGLLGHYHFTGRVIHAETLGFGCVHGRQVHGYDRRREERVARLSLSGGTSISGYLLMSPTVQPAAFA